MLAPLTSHRIPELVYFLRFKYLRQISAPMVEATPSRGRDNGWCASAGWPLREEGGRGKGIAIVRRGSTWQRIPIIASDAARGQGNQYAGTNCQFMLSRYYAGLIIAALVPGLHREARELGCTRIVAECIVQSMRRNDRSGVRCVTAASSPAWRRNSRTFQSRG